MLLLLLQVPLFVAAADHTDSKSSVVHFMQNFSDISSVLESLPKECTKNGKKYKEGEDFCVGHLRYKCQKYGVYSIEGCVTEKKKNLKLGDIVVIDNVKSQCLSKGNSVFYRETACGIPGQPECDEVDLPSGYKEAEEREKTKPKEKQITVSGLPKGWKVLNESRQDIPGTKAHVISRTLMFEPISSGSSSRLRRQSGRGIGSVVEIVPVGNEGPQMPLSMLLNGGKKNTTGSHGRTSSGWTTQDVSATLNIQSKGRDRVVGTGTGSRDLSSRTPTVSNTKGLKSSSSTQYMVSHIISTTCVMHTRASAESDCGPFCDGKGHIIRPHFEGWSRMFHVSCTLPNETITDLSWRATVIRVFCPETVSGWHSDTKWNGKTISVNGRTVAAGPGTFTFGSSPTGTFLRKDD